jgi:hypothetical protein
MTKILGLWLLPMFVRILPFATVLRVWDMFFLEGAFRASGLDSPPRQR